MKFRKRDYLIFYIIVVTIFMANLMSPVKASSVFSSAVGAVFPALILGTLTNFLFKKR